jgi:hypothetical protein
MTNADLLVQRFLDQELSGEERLQLLVRLGRETALREKLIDLERLLLDVNRLPRPTVPDGFVEGVLRRTVPAPRPRSWRSLVHALWVPRTFQFNVASAVAAGSVVLLVASVIVAGRRSEPRTEERADATAASAATTSPVLVRLIVLQPGARTVQVAGDFNGWDPAQTPLEQISNAAWAVTIALEPGRYEYMYLVDGQKWVGDPFAVEQSDDGFGSRNAVLEVRPT